MVFIRRDPWCRSVYQPGLEIPRCISSAEIAKLSTYLSEFKMSSLRTTRSVKAPVLLVVRFVSSDFWGDIPQVLKIPPTLTDQLPPPHHLSHLSTTTLFRLTHQAGPKRRAPSLGADSPVHHQTVRRTSEQDVRATGNIQYPQAIPSPTTSQHRTTFGFRWPEASSPVFKTSGEAAVSLCVLSSMHLAIAGRPFKTRQPEQLRLRCGRCTSRSLSVTRASARLRTRLSFNCWPSMSSQTQRR